MAGMVDELDPKNFTNIPEEGETEDDVVEFVFNADGEEDLKANLKKLRKDLKEAKVKEMEYLTNWQRERADFLNYKKDETTRLSRIKESVTEQFIEELLPVLDAYDLAFSNKEAWEKVDKNWRMGVEYIHQQLLKVLADNGVSTITANTGDGFDPNLHESMGTIEINGKEKEHTIAHVAQSGYKMGERVLRPARVKVFEAK